MVAHMCHTPHGIFWPNCSQTETMLNSGSPHIVKLAVAWFFMLYMWWCSNWLSFIFYKVPVCVCVCGCSNDFNADLCMCLWVLLTNLSCIAHQKRGIYMKLHACLNSVMTCNLFRVTCCHVWNVEVYVCMFIF